MAYHGRVLPVVLAVTATVALSAMVKGPQMQLKVWGLLWIGHLVFVVVRREVTRIPCIAFSLHSPMHALTWSHSTWWLLTDTDHTGAADNLGPPCVLTLI